MQNHENSQRIIDQHLSGACMRESWFITLDLFPNTVLLFLL